MNIADKEFEFEFNEMGDDLDIDIEIVGNKYDKKEIKRMEW